jgi:phage tail-like protein
MRPPNLTQSPSRLLDYLPAIYRTDPFLGRFLRAFEKILLGRDDGVDVCYKDGAPVSREDNPDICYRGLEETIADLAAYFDPQQTPEEFLSWLAGWAALSLRADLPVGIQRQFIANMVYRYRFRGTKANLQELLRIFVRGRPEITETAVAELQIGIHSTIGEDTYLRGGPPHFFRVTIVLPEELQGRPRELARQLAIARAIIELEKPAHTAYELIPIYPGTLQVGMSSTVGVDTLLGSVPEISSTT